MSMTREQVIKEFKEYILPGIIEAYGEDDIVAIRTAWNDYTDALCKDGLITENQYNNWEGPY